jgi:opacity protein-like surface antigen
VGKWVTGLLSAFALLSLLLAFTSTPAEAELYVAGQVGLNLPHSLSNVEVNRSGVIFDGNDQSLKGSLMYGAKLGYYFESLKWLGVETEGFKATPYLKQQNVTTFGGINFLTAPGGHLSVLTWAPVNIVVRHQIGAFEPYAGIGLGFNSSRVSVGNGASSGGGPGLNTQLGLRYRITTNLAVFGEWKFNHARLKHTDFMGFKGHDLSVDYNAHTLCSASRIISKDRFL